MYKSRRVLAFLATITVLVAIGVGVVVALPATYRSYAEVDSALHQLENDHPNLAKVVSLGVTAGGSTIWAVKLSDNVSMDEDENNILFVGNHHAREKISVEVPLRLAEHLAANYSDPQIQEILDNQQVWVVPLLNPDGYEYTRTNSLPWMWRKNLRDNTDLYPSCFGTDLNRNYGGPNWGAPGYHRQSNTCLHNEETFIGRGAFSEAETIALRELIQGRFQYLAQPIDALISYHNYGQLILWPWGYKQNPIESVTDRAFMKDLAIEMRDAIGAVHNERYTPKQSYELYATSGDLTDWAYDTLKIPAFTIELRPEMNLWNLWCQEPDYVNCFDLDDDEIVPTFQENLPAAMVLLQKYVPALETPTQQEPEYAGDHANPHKIFAIVSGIGKGRTKADFSVEIGGLPGAVVSAVNIDVNRYELGIIPPTQIADGLYNLRINLNGASVNQADAVYYSGSPNADVMLILDRSGSMGSSGYMEPAKAAASQFVDFTQVGDQIGVASFNEAASLDFTLSPVVTSTAQLFEDDMESGGGSWVGESPWAISTENSHSSNHAWSDSPGGNYANYQDIWLTLNTPLNLTSLVNPTLTFWSWLDLETSYDYGYVEISTNGGSTWTPIRTYTGHSLYWSLQTISLASYQNQTALRLRFRLTTDYSVVDDGWYIDDVVIGESDARDAAKSAIFGIVAGGATSIGAGLNTGQGELNLHGDPVHPWAIVLLSDGYENTAPWVADVLPAIVASKTTVHTIALGPVSDQALLLDIASQTGGTYNYAPNPDALAAIYSTITGSVSGQQTLFLESDEVFQGQLAQQQVALDAGLFEATLAVTWSGGNGVDLVLVTPMGTLIDPDVAETNPTIDFLSGGTFQYYRVRHPQAGNWTMRLYGRSLTLGLPDPVPYTAIVTGQSNTTLNFYTDLNNYLIGDRIHLTAVLADEQGISNAQVAVEVTSPVAALESPPPLSQWERIGGDSQPFGKKSLGPTRTQTLSLYDDGQHEDGSAHDGVYANSFEDTAVAGIYTIDLQAIGESNEGSPFTRLASLSVHVAEPPVPTIQVTASPAAVAEAGDVLNTQFRVTNSGSESVSLDLLVGEIEVILGWGDLSAIPSTVTLAPGQSVIYPVIVTVPDNAPRGSLFVLPFTAVSQTDPDVLASDALEVYIPFRYAFLPIARK